MVDLAGIEHGLRAAKDEEFVSEDGKEGWALQIVSEATCSVTYSSFVKSFLKDSHLKLLEGYVAKLKEGPVVMAR